jgi:hypothetical protein
MEFSHSTLFFDLSSFQFVISHILISVCTHFHYMFFVLLLVDLPEDYCQILVLSVMLTWPLQFNVFILRYVLKVSREINLSEEFTLFPHGLPIALHYIKLRLTLFCRNKLVLTEN